METDPDIIIGYNICNFDLPYLLNRAEALKLRDFPYWGRMRNKCASLHQAPACMQTSHELGRLACRPPLSCTSALVNRCTSARCRCHICLQAAHTIDPAVGVHFCMVLQKPSY